MQNQKLHYSVHVHINDMNKQYICLFLILAVPLTAECMYKETHTHTHTHTRKYKILFSNQLYTSVPFNSNSCSTRSSTRQQQHIIVSLSNELLLQRWDAVDPTALAVLQLLSSCTLPVYKKLLHTTVYTLLCNTLRCNHTHQTGNQ